MLLIIKAGDRLPIPAPLILIYAQPGVGKSLIRKDGQERISV